MEGAVLGSYRIVRKIGEGGMGAVWLAEHTLLGRRAAVKVLHPSFSRQPQVVKRFFNEARAATSVADPGIVQIFDFGNAADGSAYIVMEYLDGETLDARLRRLRALPLAHAARIVRQVATSLAAAHARGIIHRDLKPENILLVHDPEVAGCERTKILDFGIAKLVSDDASRVKTQTAVVMGTPRYMSPEQCRGAGYVDHRSDIYSLGCVLFHLVVGAPPFEGEGPGDVIAMHLRESPPIASARGPGLPREIDAILMRCLAKSPDGRFQSMLDLAKALGGVLTQIGAADPAEVGPRWNAAPTLPSAGGDASVVWIEPGGRPPSTLSSGATPVTVAETTARRRRRGLITAALMVAAGAAGAIAFVRTADGPAVAPDAELPALDAPLQLDAASLEVADAGVLDAIVPDAIVPDAAGRPLAPARPVRRPRPRPGPSATPADPCDLDNDGTPDTRC